MLRSAPLLLFILVLGCRTNSASLGNDGDTLAPQGDFQRSDFDRIGDTVSASCVLPSWQRSIPISIEPQDVLDPGICLGWLQSVSGFEEISQHEFSEACWAFDIDVTPEGISIPALGGYTRVSLDGVTEQLAVDVQAEYPPTWSVLAATANEDVILYVGHDQKEFWAHTYSSLTGLPIGTPSFVFSSLPEGVAPAYVSARTGTSFDMLTIGPPGVGMVSLERVTPSDDHEFLMSIDDARRIFWTKDQEHLLIFDSTGSEVRIWRGCLGNSSERDLVLHSILTGAVPSEMGAGKSLRFHAILADGRVAMSWLVADSEGLPALALPSWSWTGRWSQRCGMSGFKSFYEKQMEIAFDGSTYVVAYLDRENVHALRFPHFVRFDRDGRQQGCVVQTNLKRVDYGSGRNLRYPSLPVRLRAHGDTFLFNTCTTNADASNLFAPWGVLMRLRFSVPPEP